MSPSAPPPPLVARRGRLLVAGGIYGNWQAFCQLRAIASSYGIGFENWIITGDLAAYCANGAEVAAFCREHLHGKSIIVRGNCERALAEGLDDCACGFTPGSHCHALSAAWYRHATATVSDSLKAWMGALPPQVLLNWNGKQYAVIHAAADADNTFVFASTPAAEKAEQIATLAVSGGVICGHSGIPFTQRVGGVVWHNSGAVGMPANDGTPRVWCAIWDEADDVSDDGFPRIHHYPFDYDHAAAAAAMQDAGLPADYQATLSTGIWPSDSVLPTAEKQKQAHPLQL